MSPRQDLARFYKRLEEILNKDAEKEGNDLCSLQPSIVAIEGIDGTGLFDSRLNLIDVIVKLFRQEQFSARFGTLVWQVLLIGGAPDNYSCDFLHKL